MSDRSSLHSSILAKFREAFGEPHSTVNSDAHWSLRRFEYQPAVNVLVNGAKDEPIVWIFNPLNPKDGVFHSRVNSESDIDRLVQRIVGTVRGDLS